MRQPRSALRRAVSLFAAVALVTTLVTAGIAPAIALTAKAPAATPAAPAIPFVPGAPVAASVSGEIEFLTLDSATDPWSGGTIVVGGQIVILPRNLLLDLPANRMTLSQLFAQAPSACHNGLNGTGESGLAKADTCNLSGAGGIASISANKTSAGNVIAGDVLIEKGVESVTGVVTYLNYDEGYLRLAGEPGSPTTGVMVRLNDPTSRHTVQTGAGCAGGLNCSADPRFTLDADNYTATFTSGYPVCIPSTVSRTFADVLVPSIGTTAQAGIDGSGDVLCPQTNRANPVGDSRLFAPIILGDPLTAEGNFETIGGVHFLSAHTLMVNLALTTKTGAGSANQPDYIMIDEAFIDAPGFQNQRTRALFIGFATVAPADVLLYALHYDPGTHAKHEFPLGSSAGCDAAAGAGTCSGQGIIPDSTDVFRIRYDVDFGVGATSRLDPCAHLMNDPRMGTGICPNWLAGGDTVNGNAKFNTDITEMFGILSPIPHEVQFRTGRKYASLQAGGTQLITLDINGADATNGQYLFPFGINLGGIDIPNFFEINIAEVSTPFSFSGIPWNLDRRLSPGGCAGACEGTAQPLDPFPFEGVAMDPRIQAPAVPPLFLGTPQGAYFDPNFTNTTLTRAADRILSYVSGTPFVGGSTPDGFNFDGNNTLLAWPPADPAHIAIGVTPPLPVGAPVAPLPVITSFTPLLGPVGTSVTITGTDFTGASDVSFNGTAAFFMKASATAITALVPTGATTGKVTVTTAGGTASSAADFTVTVLAPTVTSVTPTSGPTAGGTVVTITGTDFSTVPGETKVNFIAGGSAATLANEATGLSCATTTSCTATSPAGAPGKVDVHVTVLGVQSPNTPADSFTYNPPTVTAINPSSGPTAGGTVVTITGTDFSIAAGATTVNFIPGGASAGPSNVATAVSCASTSSCTATSPAGTAGQVDVHVTVGGVQSPNTPADNFTYVAPAVPPTVVSVTPASGSTAGGTPVTIAGNDFVVGGTTFTFGGTAATGVTCTTTISCSAVTPAHAAAAVSVVATTSAGSGTLVAGFTFVAPVNAPTITSFTPTSGNSGTTVTINGTNFTGVTSITIGGVPVRTVTSSTDTQLVVVAGTGLATGPVTVTTPNGTATSATNFQKKGKAN